MSNYRQQNVIYLLAPGPGRECEVGTFWEDTEGDWHFDGMRGYDSVLAAWDAATADILRFGCGRIEMD